jgi:hypothetical protein
MWVVLLWQQRSLLGPQFWEEEKFTVVGIMPAKKTAATCGNDQFQHEDEDGTEDVILSVVEGQRNDAWSVLAEG